MRKLLYLTKNLNFHEINLMPLYVSTCDINEKHVISDEKQMLLDAITSHWKGQKRKET